MLKELGSLVEHEEEAKLCPVRALRTFLETTKYFRGDINGRLFVVPRNPR